MDLELKNIGQFIGTLSYYKMYGFDITEGVKYLCDNGYYWFVSDSLIAIRYYKLHLKNPFIVVKLKLHKKGASIIIEDGNYNKLYQQNYEYTDAKAEAKFYVQNNVAMLPSEY